MGGNLRLQRRGKGACSVPWFWNVFYNFLKGELQGKKKSRFGGVTQRWKVSWLVMAEPSHFLNVLLLCLVSLSPLPLPHTRERSSNWILLKASGWWGHLQSAVDSFPTRWQADGNRARGLKKATSQARGRGKSSRPVLPRKVHYHLPPGFLSQNSRLPLLALSSPMTSLLRPPFPISHCGQPTALLRHFLFHSYQPMSCGITWTVSR